MPNWKIKKKILIKNKEIFTDIHPLILEILFQRGVDSEEKVKSFLSPKYERDILDPFLFSNMEKVLERIDNARVSKEKVLIYGDYDADGITAAAILKEALDRLEIPNSLYIPDKKNEGYGLNIPAVKMFSKQGVKLIITVDCGISNYNEVEKAREMGLDTIIIDHHHIPKNPPKALIINPQMESSGYPFRELAGVGVSFKVVQALYKKFLPGNVEHLKWFLDLVTIGTVADCVPLIGENRVIVKYGLIVLSKTRRTGLQELLNVGRIRIDENNFPDTRQISFQIAPRLNAAGRMDHANMAYNLIMEKNRVTARNLALELESKNQERQKATNQIFEEIKALAENSFKNKKFIFAVDDHFPIGIAGLVAGKVTDKFNKPSAILQKGEKTSKGSFRSIPSVNIIEALDKCSDLLVRYGGHSQAAGITIDNKNLEKFYKKFDSLIETELKDRDVSPIIEIDAEIKPEDIDFELTESLKKFEPFGVANPQPVFLMKNLIVEEVKTVGNGDKHLKLFLRGDGGTPKILEAIGFNFSNHLNLTKGNKVDVVFNLEQDNWNGNQKIQLKMLDLKLSA
jgi:single-stranded-DNA-specific exonuclease